LCFGSSGKVKIHNKNAKGVIPGFSEWIELTFHTIFQSMNACREETNLMNLHKSSEGTTPSYTKALLLIHVVSIDGRIN
jgi:hypothetical protein